MDPDTNIGGLDAAFPATGYAVIEASNSSDAEARKQALDLLIAAYWKPVYKYIRLKKRQDNESAKEKQNGGKGERGTHGDRGPEKADDEA